MDPFTQRMLERAEKRSKALGISSTAKFPLTEYNQDNITTTASTSPTKQSSPRKHSNSISKSTTKIVKNITERQQDSNESKENVDLAVEINITTGPNIQVQVEVEEQDIDSEGNIIKNKLDPSEATAMIRDSSRNRLQRLGALYSDNADLSSPIHRTEAKFHEEIDSAQSSSSVKPVSRFGKLAALASSINNWEDDLSHPDYKHTTKDVSGPPKPKRQSPSPIKKPVCEEKKTGTTPKKYAAPAPPKESKDDKKVVSPKRGPAPPPPTTKTTPTFVTSKQLKWDPKVMDALESQGFQRRQSNNAKLVYNYKNDQAKNEMENNAREEPCDVENARERKVPSVVPGSEIEKKAELKKTTATAKVAANKQIDLPRGIVSGRAALFETESVISSNFSTRSKQKDPAEMSLKERMALFEKNKGQAPIPKAPIAISVGSKQISGEKVKEHRPVIDVQPSRDITYPQPSSVPVKQISSDAVVAESSASGHGIRNTVAALLSGGSTISESQINQDVRKQRQQEMDLLLNRFVRPQGDEGQKTPTATPMTPPKPPPMPPSARVSIDAVSSNSNKRRSGDSIDEETNDSSKVRSVLDDIKRIKVNPPKSGRLYPTLSDIETTASDQDYTTATVTESENDRLVGENRQPQEYYDEEDSYMDSEDGDSFAGFNGSLGREILKEVARNDPYRTNNGHRHSGRSAKADSSATGSEGSDALGDIDAYLDDDDDEEDQIMEEVSQPKKGSVSSDSFSYQKSVKKVHYATIDEDEEIEFSGMSRRRSPIKSDLTVHPADDNNMVTLVHTVSFYRKQQHEISANNTPVKKVQRPVSNVEYTSTDNDESVDMEDKNNENILKVQEKIKKLYDEVSKQQNVISQTSQALNLCAATIEFSGSTEAVEGERHLLVATHRRQVTLDEIQRLRVEGSLRTSGAPKERGRLSIKDVTVPLRPDYVKKLASDAVSGHHLVCLLKYNENVLATRAIPTLPGLVSVKFPDALQLNNVYADFKVTLEIYGMTAHKEILPHEIKYHIASNKKGSKMLTPKGKKGGDNRLVMPPVQSPAGPNAVRTPALTQYGFVIFSLREIQRTHWTLNQTSGVSPLDGSVHMAINCELSVSVDYRGFLTMFEDVSGFGAWHRRWCRLHGHVLSYWKYPDDEKKKAPIASIDLYNCCSQKITIAPRDVCARLNTMLLEIKRPSQEDDIQSLVLVRHGKTTIVRHLLSADTKEEREDWCANLNKSLVLLRAWGSPE